MADHQAFLLLQELGNGHAVARCLHVIASLGVADALGDAPESAQALASRLNLNADALDRVLRLLASKGVFERREDGHYAHTAASRLLRSDDARHLRSFILMHALRLNWASYGELEHTLRTGEPAWDKVSPISIWQHFSQNPEESRIFNEAMSGKSVAVTDAVLNAYDFSRFGSIADIGGGRGHVLAAILAATPNANGVLFDQPHVLATIAAPPQRMTLRAGDFFKGGLPTCDAYIITDVLHDWTDDETVTILKSVREAAAAGARVLIIEALLPAPLANVIDIHMMTYLRGRKRTGAEFAALSHAAGFKFERVIDAPPNYSIVESVAA